MLPDANLPPPHLARHDHLGLPGHQVGWPSRSDIIDRLGQLESVPVASPDELLALVQRRALSGRGCGFVDISLLASALLSERTMLWALDKRLAAVATELGLAYRPAQAA